MISTTGESTLSFVDTNVLVYAFEKSSSPKKRVAQQLMNQLMDEDRLRVSTQVLQELFVTLTRKVAQPCSSQEALAVLEDLAAWPLTVIDYAAIRAAAGLADQAQLSFWDALVVVAAARAGAAGLHPQKQRQETPSWHPDYVRPRDAVSLEARVGTSRGDPSRPKLIWVSACAFDRRCHRTMFHGTRAARLGRMGIRR